MPSPKPSKAIWEQEYVSPLMFPHVGEASPSDSAYWFYGWALDHLDLKSCRVMDVCCGKGRNGLWMASKCQSVDGFDFIPSAVKAAADRAEEAGYANCTWAVHDAAERWPYPDDSFDVALDIFALSEMQGEDERQHYVSEMARVLKPGGIVVSETATATSGFFEFLYKTNRRPDAKSITLPNGKVETVLSDEALASVYQPFEVLNKKLVRYPEMQIYGVTTPCDLIWAIFRSKKRSVRMEATEATAERQS